MPHSDPTIPDSDRYGDDLLARIDELHKDQKGDGWRPLLFACRQEIRSLRDMLMRIHLVSHHDGRSGTLDSMFERRGEE
jgi:hypothetical protein